MESLSEVFRDMNEVRDYVEQMKPTLSPDDYQFMRYLFGLLENQAVSDPILLHGQTVEIDRFLVPMIVDLNGRGFETLASCSGLKEEHAESRFGPNGGYLAIAFNKDLLQYLEQHINDSIILAQRSECYLKPSVSIEIKSDADDILKEKWRLVWDALKAYAVNKNKGVVN